MRLKNKLLAILSIVVLSSFTFMKKDHDKITIVVDAGHGGTDPGSKGSAILEKNYTLEIAQKIKKLNQNPNIEIILTRDSDNFVELHKRSAMINDVNPTYFISLHLNSSMDKNKNGYEVFHHPKNENAKELAEKFVKTIQHPLKNNGVKVANFHLLRETKVPGFLFEIGFISNNEDEKYITSEEGKDKIAKQILNFIQN